MDVHSHLVYLCAQRLVEYRQPAVYEPRVHGAHRLAAQGLRQNAPIQQFTDKGLGRIAKKGDVSAPFARESETRLVAPKASICAVAHITETENPEQKIYQDRVPP